MAAVSGDGSAGHASLDVAFEAAVAAVQRDCSAMHMTGTGIDAMSGVPALAADAAAVAAAVTAVESLPDAVMTMAGAVAGEGVAVAAAALDCSRLPEAEELQYRLGFEHTAVNGCTPEKIPA